MPEPWLDEWIERHDATLARFFARRGADPLTNEELRQDTWVALWRACPEQAPKAQGLAYLLQVARSRFIDRLRRSRSELPREERALEDLRAVEPAPLTAFDLLRHLEPMEAEALRLRFVCGHSIAAIAAAMGAKEGTVKSWIHRGRMRLKRLLEEEPR